MTPEDSHIILVSPTANLVTARHKQPKLASVASHYQVKLAVFSSFKISKNFCVVSIGYDFYVTASSGPFSAILTTVYSHLCRSLDQVSEVLIISDYNIETDMDDIPILLLVKFKWYDTNAALNYYSAPKCRISVSSVS